VEKRPLLAVTLVSALLSANAAVAQESNLVTFRVNSFAINRSTTLANVFPVGTPMEAIYTFRTDAPNVGNSSIGIYFALVSATIRVGNYQATATKGELRAYNDFPSGPLNNPVPTDVYQLHIFTSEVGGTNYDLTGPSLLPGWTLRNFSFSIQGPSNVLSSNALPTVPPAFNPVGDNTYGWQLVFFDSNGQSQVVSGLYNSFFPEASGFTITLVEGYTLPGSEVEISPEVTLPDGTDGSVSLTFDTVEAAGETTVTTSSQGAPPPTGFKLTNPPVYYEIATTATFTGNVRVCLNWAEGQIANESNVKMFHFEGNQWVDITDHTSRDTLNNSVCGTTTSFSPFTLMEVKYPFTGFLQPVDNLPTINAVKAGAAVPVKFSLGGDFGLNIFASGYPKAQLMQCITGEPIAAIEETVTAGSSSLFYDAETALYTYVWKTDKGWANSCRELQLKLDDGEVYTAWFTLRK
jgi:hypothetical protein